MTKVIRIHEPGGQTVRRAVAVEADDATPPPREVIRGRTPHGAKANHGYVAAFRHRFVSFRPVKTSLSVEPLAAPWRPV